MILNRLNFDEPIDAITTYGIRFVDENEFLFNAQLKMTKHRIKRLVVRNVENEITGILDLITITSFFASHTYAVANELEMALNIEELKKANFDIKNLSKEIKKNSDVILLDSKTILPALGKENKTKKVSKSKLSQVDNVPQINQTPPTLQEIKMVIDAKFPKDASGQYENVGGVFAYLNDLATTYNDQSILEMYYFDESSGVS